MPSFSLRLFDWNCVSLPVKLVKIWKHSGETKPAKLKWVGNTKLFDFTFRYVIQKMCSRRACYTLKTISSSAEVKSRLDCCSSTTSTPGHNVLRLDYYCTSTTSTQPPVVNASCPGVTNVKFGKRYLNGTFSKGVCVIVPLISLCEPFITFFYKPI